MEGNLKIVLHPLVALQISDHSTRSKYFVDDIPYACGVIYGTVDEKAIELCSTVEVGFAVSEPLTLNSEAYTGICHYHKKNYPNETQIGWYSSRQLTEEEFSKLHKLFSEKFEVFVRVVFNNTDDSPLSIHEWKHGEWQQRDYVYQSEIAERVALSNLQSEGTTDSQVGFNETAYRVLESHLAEIEEFLLQTEKGEIPFHPDLVRKCADISRWWDHDRSGDSESALVEDEEARLSLLCSVLAERSLDLTKIREGSD